MTRRSHYSREFIDRLRTTSLFCGCSASEVRLAASLLTELWFSAGRVLIRQDEVGNECFVLVSGEAVVERDGMIVGHATAGAIVGELALMGGVSRTATVTATTDIQLLVMSRREFASLRALRIRSIEERLAATASEHCAALARLPTRALSTSAAISTA